MVVLVVVETDDVGCGGGEGDGGEESLDQRPWQADSLDEAGGVMGGGGVAGDVEIAVRDVDKGCSHELRLLELPTAVGATRGGHCVG